MTTCCGLKMKGIIKREASSSIRDHNDTGHAASFRDLCILDKAKNNVNLSLVSI